VFEVQKRQTVLVWYVYRKGSQLPFEGFTRIRALKKAGELADLADRAGAPAGNAGDQTTAGSMPPAEGVPCVECVGVEVAPAADAPTEDSAAPASVPDVPTSSNDAPAQAPESQRATSQHPSAPPSARQAFRIAQDALVYIEEASSSFATEAHNARLVAADSETAVLRAMADTVDAARRAEADAALAARQAGAGVNRAGVSRMLATLEGGVQEGFDQQARVARELQARLAATEQDRDELLARLAALEMAQVDGAGRR